MATFQSVTASQQWDARAAGVLQGLMRGKLNSLGDVTLTASSATTVVADPLAGPDSVILWMPTTANAAAEIGAGGMYVSSRGDGTFTITHANNAQNDRTFRYVVFG